MILRFCSFHIFEKQRQRLCLLLVGLYAKFPKKNRGIPLQSRLGNSDAAAIFGCIMQKDRGYGKAK